MKRTSLTASYSGTIAEWDAMYDRLVGNGETRTARAIRDALDKVRARPDVFGRFFTYREQCPKWGIECSLRFRGGTVAKLDALIRDMFDD